MTTSAMGDSVALLNADPIAGDSMADDICRRPSRLCTDRNTQVLDWVWADGVDKDSIEDMTVC